MINMSYDIQIKNMRTNEVFNFVPGMINNENTKITIGIDPNITSGTGPMMNQGIDIDGINKTITLSGQFIDTTSSVVSGTTNNIQSKQHMKLWFEALLSGYQRTVEYTSKANEYSSTGSGTKRFIDEISGVENVFDCNFVTTKGYIVDFTCDTNSGDVEQYPFSLTLFVAGV